MIKSYWLGLVLLGSYNRIEWFRFTEHDSWIVLHLWTTVILITQIPVLYKFHITQTWDYKTRNMFAQRQNVILPKVVDKRFETRIHNSMTQLLFVRQDRIEELVSYSHNILIYQCAMCNTCFSHWQTCQTAMKNNES